MSQKLIDSRDLEIKLGSYRVGSANQLSDPNLLPQAQEYKRSVSGRMIPLDRTEIGTKVPTADYAVSRKIDGEFTMIIFRHDQTITLNPGGTVRTGLPATEEVGRLLRDQGIKNAILVGELHAPFGEKRERIHDVVRLARAPESTADLEALRLSIFDILEIDQDREWPEYTKTLQKIEQLFQKGERVRPVPTIRSKNIKEIETIFATHVDQDGGEGIVLRSDTAGAFKIKPRRTLDAVVIGFTESVGERTGMMHDLLLALRRQDGTLHVLCRVGGGFSEDLRRTLLSDLKDAIVESEYAEVNSDHEAYQMVKPKWIAEISCLDLISQSTRGAPIQRMTLDWDSNEKIYRIVRRLPMVSVISPQFVRFREDKTNNYQDIRIEQVSQVVEVPMVDRDAKKMTLPKSEVLQREVFTKVLKGETMVRKFVMWKTNKEASSEHPAFVVHYTDFSPNRAQPLAREVRISNSADQIKELYEELKQENIKKGWDPVASGGSEVSTAAIESTPASEKSSAATEKPNSTATEKKSSTASEKKDSTATETKSSTVSETKNSAANASETLAEETPKSKPEKKVAAKKATAAKVVEKETPVEQPAKKAPAKKAPAKKAPAKKASAKKATPEKEAEEKKPPRKAAKKKS